MKTFPAPPVVYRVGRAGSSLELAPWTLAPFSGRFDDPEQEYRVRYVGISRRGALIERLAKYRPDLDAIAAINEVEMCVSSRQVLARIRQTTTKRN